MKSTIRCPHSRSCSESIGRIDQPPSPPLPVPLPSLTWQQQTMKKQHKSLAQVITKRKKIDLRAWGSMRCSHDRVAVRWQEGEGEESKRIRWRRVAARGEELRGMDFFSLYPLGFYQPSGYSPRAYQRMCFVGIAGVHACRVQPTNQTNWLWNLDARG
jgi:hypothetical protein